MMMMMSLSLPEFSQLLLAVANVPLKGALHEKRINLRNLLEVAQCG
jgi:hypothetical protein